MEDPEWHMENSPATQRLEEYSDLFLAYVHEMFQTRDLREAGFPIREIDLTFTDWQVLVVIDAWVKRREMEAMQWPLMPVR